MTPGTHPQKVRIKTTKKLPQPLSTTASGGKKTARRTRIILMTLYLCLISGGGFSTSAFHLGNCP